MALYRDEVEGGFARQLHEQLNLFTEPGWTVAALANWLDRQIPHHDVTQVQSTLFLHRALTALIEARGLSIDQIARAKFRLARSLEAKIDGYRSEFRRRSYQERLFAPGAAIEVSPECVFRLTEDRYAPNWLYEGSLQLRKHAFRRIGELQSEGEELRCAAFIAGLDEVETWVRNLERRPTTSFWLQTATDRFYPDFVARLTDGRILVVESKGEIYWTNDDSKEKRAVGELWEARSGGKCLFVMPRGPDWQAIRAKVQSS